VLIATIPDVGITPFAASEGSANATILSTLTARFNSKLRIGLINDGHMIGLILLDEAVQAAKKSGTINATDPACDAAAILPDCSLLTLTTAATTTMPTPPTGATVTSWLWADATRLGVYGQSTLSALAATRAQGNPF
jgi:outer membrane lipase/esterase